MLGECSQRLIKPKGREKAPVSLVSRDYINESNREFSNMTHQKELMELLKFFILELKYKIKTLL